jgi:hypothetical protein
MGSYRITEAKTVNLTKVQETFLDALDIEVLDSDEIRSTVTSFECYSAEWRTANALVQKGIITFEGERSPCGTFAVSLTQFGIATIAAMEAKASNDSDVHKRFQGGATNGEQ